MFSFVEGSDELAMRLVRESLMPLFKKLHPERNGWNLSLVNIAVTGMEEKQEYGKDIGAVFKKQQDHRKMWDAEVTPFVEDDIMDDAHVEISASQAHINHPVQGLQRHDDCSANLWEAEDEDEDMLDGNDRSGYICPLCKEAIPAFAQGAHERFHENSASSSQVH